MLIVMLFCPFTYGKIFYVDDDAVGANDGTNWVDAYMYPQDAIATATAGDDILVAQGIYKPDRGVGISLGDWRASFHLKNGVTIKGGYAGLSAIDPNARDVGEYETILSGDISGNDSDVNDPCDLFDVPNRHDNSWNVVIGSNIDETAILDGLTITGGYISIIMFGESPAGGAGMLISSGSPTLINCTFTENVTGNSGGGLLIYGDSNPTLHNCRFSRNYANGGGGMCSGRSSSPILINCTFIDNYAMYKGGAMFNGGSNPKLTGCTFSNNSVPDNPYGVSAGGGAMCNSASNIILTDCTFCDNIAGCGAGMYNENNSILKLTNCTFRNNIAKEHPGGGMFNEDVNNLVLNKCIFSGNSGKLNGGGMFNRYSNVVLVNCIFSGNKANDELRTNPPYILPGEGGGLFAFGDTTLINCTFYGNWALKDRAISKYTFSDVRLVNCILWDGGNEVTQTGTKPIIIYSSIQGDWEGEGNIDEEPLFVNPGYWADADDPNIAVEPNDPNAIWVEGDYHLKSQAGRWNPISKSWVQDDVTSPCIDAGDPNSPIGPEPFPNGGIINMGAYGGTVEASKSYFGKPVCESIIAGDINGDCKVDFDDLMILMTHWLEDYTPQD
jgi:parallel beta-helix repeat protein